MKVPRVRLLPPELAGKIAAGEVVERPSSVVKELVENSLDAGATRITIELEQGGRERIRVVDNGCGIVADDLPLLFARHATSKLSGEDDLQHIRSLGFRGEALAAIGSVARVCVQSRTAEAPVGAQVVCHAGQVGAVELWAGPTGTCVEVRQLFFNTPVRRKFLRSVATELGHIVETVQRLALPFTGVHFRVLHEGRDLLEIPASWEERERIRYCLGDDLADHLLPLEYAAHQVRLHGWIGHPEHDKPSGRWQYFYLNQRYIRDRVLAHALQEAYRGYLMVGRQPVAFLFLEVPPETVDVNVHPTKIEVRFRDQQLIYQAVLVGVRQALQRAALTPPLLIPGLGSDWAPPPRPASEIPASTPQPQLSPPAFSQRAAPSREIPIGATPTAPRSSPATEADRLKRSSPPSTQARPAPSAGSWHDAPRQPSDPPIATPAEQSPSTSHPHDSEVTWFGTAPPVRAMQLHNTYLLVETPDGLLLVDQHALHERILYEQFRHNIQAGTLTRQTLLIPEPVDLTPSQAALLLEHRAALEHVGLSVGEFGGNTVLVTALPACWKRSAAECVHLVAEYLAEVQSLPEPQQLLDDLLKRMACRAAVKAGDLLQPADIAFLLEHRHLLQDAHHCPHGRPTALFLSKQELERQFRRLG
ncbi:DNA mismatch repair protein MutL [bacterium HR36]|nr:DNA mismatch repair protein MutL [bacterium HR36]